jgi:hypothetical protein
VLTQLGHHAAGVISQFDPAELAFSAVLLHRLQAPDYRPLTSHALRILADAQTPDGSWPTSRLLSYSNQRLLHVASFEIGLALANLLIRQLDRGDSADAPLLLDVLHKTFTLVANTFAEVGTYRGWCNDRTRDPKLIESWTTAVITSFLQKYHSALSSVRQEAVLAKYQVWGGKATSFSWPDLAPLIGRSNQIDITPLASIADPTDGGDLHRHLATRLLEPTMRSAIQRPPPASLLLTGPSEAQKRMAVRAVSAALGWPLVTVTPADIFVVHRGGTAEAALTETFRDLTRTRRLIVFFDECDTYFRRRSSAQGATDRTAITAATQSMLHWLRRLRQHGWTIQVCATTATIDKLELDVLRPGTFDFHQPYNNPTLRAQERYVRGCLGVGHSAADATAEALRQWAARDRAQDNNERFDELSFEQLDDLVGLINSVTGSTDFPTIYSFVRSVAKAGPPALLQT